VPQGSIKEYDVNDKTGIIQSDDGETEWEIDSIAMETGMFRFFRVGQRVTFDLVDEGGQKKVRNLRIGLA
jgi:cold shock CspA family protein